ncbi:hypothetical protein DFH07DRAFT_776814 [Mycena maculata]|uniref:F-box domain-containing protein n=1 Tax=Mycena maculata TaxID=230809 RepID=A0AAD7IN36_9AGAR|nr:hypothetical protein DFH07DRAFT_776814 [Mycena maculata]
MCFSSLTTVTIGRGPDYDNLRYDTSECVEIMHSAPNLMACTFCNVYYIDIDRLPTSLVTHSMLRRLTLYGYPTVTEGFYHSSAFILRHLTLPALEYLSISCDETSRENICAFLARSSPPLKSLYMVTAGNNIFVDDVEHFLRLIPTVTNLYLWAEEFAFAVILAIGSHILPNIRNLMIFGHPDRDEYAKVLSVLSARKASGSPLKSLKIVWGCEGEKDSQLDENVIAGMRQLAADGMDIHIGIENKNNI